MENKIPQKKYSDKINSAQINFGIFCWRYLFFFQVAVFSTILNLGVRIKGDFFPISPKKAALALCKDKPIIKSKNGKNTLNILASPFEKEFSLKIMAIA